MPTVITRAGQILAGSAATTPELLASALGATAVSRGAIEHARVPVRESVFDLSPVPRA